MERIGALDDGRAEGRGGGEDVQRIRRARRLVADRRAARERLVNQADQETVHVGARYQNLHRPSAQNGYTLAPSLAPRRAKGEEKRGLRPGKSRFAPNVGAPAVIGREDRAIGAA